MPTYFSRTPPSSPRIRNRAGSLDVDLWSPRSAILNLFEDREHFWLYEKSAEHQIQKTNKNIPRRNRYILENILLNIFKFYILKYIINFLQSRDNNKKKNSAFIISRNICKKLAKHRLRTNVVDSHWMPQASKCKFEQWRRKKL